MTKYRRRTETEIEAQSRRLHRLVLWTAAALGLLSVLFSVVRARDYKKVIATYERSTDYAASAPDSSVVVRLVGRPGTPYYRLPRRPRYRHFWD